jgi:hypothetical protein
MKGVVFTEFLEMVETTFGPAVADKIIVDAQLPTGGVYTAVGTYDHRELIALVQQLSAVTNTPAGTLVIAFGRHLFERFAAGYPQFFTGVDSALVFLKNVEAYIHPEVRKLYPDAELPRFEARDLDADSLELIYRSSRHFADLAEGLIQGCVAHFNDPLDLRRQALPDENGVQAVRFVLARKPQAVA